MRAGLAFSRFLAFWKLGVSILYGMIRSQKDNNRAGNMNAPKVYDAITVADQILRIAKSKGMSLTPLQLMKLAYISHGWSYPIRGGDLFRNRIEAWKYGPVIPELYQATKYFGRNAIPLDSIGDAKESVVDEDTKMFLENVFAQYGNLSGVALSSLTHRVGTPWHKVFEPNVFGIEIPDCLIKDHYESLFSERKSSSAA